MTAGPRRFETTRWTLVLAAGRRQSADADTALAALCETYWGPVYAFIRRAGHGADESRDLTQAFFLRILEKDFFRQANPDRGRFRSFLLTSVKHFLLQERDAAHALKRGGGRPPLSLDAERAEDGYQIEAVDDETPDRLYERRWAMTAIGAALARVEARYRAGRRHDLFAGVRPFLTGDDPVSYIELSRALGMTEGALRVAVHRARRQFGDSLRETIAETVDGPGEVDAELEYLLGVVSR